MYEDALVLLSTLNLGFTILLLSESCSIIKPLVEYVLRHNRSFNYTGLIKVFTFPKFGFSISTRIEKEGSDPFVTPARPLDIFYRYLQYSSRIALISLTISSTSTPFHHAYSAHKQLLSNPAYSQARKRDIL